VAFGDTSITAIFAGPFAETVTYGAGTVKGIFVETDSTHDFGGMSPSMEYLETSGMDAAERRTFLIVPASAFATGGTLAALAEDDTLTVSSRSFAVRAFGPTEDGRLYRVRMVPA
jgi:hypothetical protein